VPDDWTEIIDRLIFAFGLMLLPFTCLLSDLINPAKLNIPPDPGSEWNYFFFTGFHYLYNLELILIFLSMLVIVMWILSKALSRWRFKISTLFLILVLNLTSFVGFPAFFGTYSIHVDSIAVGDKIYKLSEWSGWTQTLSVWECDGKRPTCFVLTNVDPREYSRLISDEINVSLKNPQGEQVILDVDGQALWSNQQ